MSSIIKTKRAKCYQCGNYVTLNIYENGNERGYCSVCKTKIYTKQHSPKEKCIKLVMQ